MKKLSDYQGEDSIELWADLLDPISEILSDKKIADVVRSGKSKVSIAQAILKNHKKSAERILLRIDDTPLNGLNVVIRLVEIISEIGNNEDVKSFFGYAVQAAKENKSSGSATESTGAKEK